MVDQPGRPESPSGSKASAASASPPEPRRPDILVQQVIAQLKALGAVSVRTMPGVEETVHFPLPKGLKTL